MFLSCSYCPCMFLSSILSHFVNTNFNFVTFCQYEMLETHILSIRNFNFVTFCQYEMLETHILSIRNVRNSHFVNTKLQFCYILSIRILTNSYIFIILTIMFLLSVHVPITLHTHVQWVTMYPNVSKTQKIKKIKNIKKSVKKCLKLLKTVKNYFFCF